MRIHDDITKAELKSLIYDPLIKYKAEEWEGRIVKKLTQVINLFKTGHWSKKRQVISSIEKQLKLYAKLDETIKERMKTDSSVNVLEEESFLRKKMENRLMDLQEVIGGAIALTKKELDSTDKELESTGKDLGSADNENSPKIDNEIDRSDIIKKHGKAKILKQNLDNLNIRVNDIFNLNHQEKEECQDLIKLAKKHEKVHEEYSSDTETFKKRTTDIDSVNVIKSDNDKRLKWEEKLTKELDFIKNSLSKHPSNNTLLNIYKKMELNIEDNRYQMDKQEKLIERWTKGIEPYSSLPQKTKLEVREQENEYYKYLNPTLDALNNSFVLSRSQLKRSLKKSNSKEGEIELLKKDLTFLKNTSINLAALEVRLNEATKINGSQEFVDHLKEFEKTLKEVKEKLKADLTEREDLLKTINKRQNR